jgi:uncharacterized protein YqgC (DUF456 family)
MTAEQWSSLLHSRVPSHWSAELATDQQEGGGQIQHIPHVVGVMLGQLLLNHRELFLLPFVLAILVLALRCQ